jgi:uncharacterized membrane protein
MLIWGAVWGALLGLLVGLGRGTWGNSLVIGALLGLAAGGSLRGAVRTLVRREIAAAAPLAAQVLAKGQPVAEEAVQVPDLPPAQIQPSALTKELEALPDTFSFNAEPGTAFEAPPPVAVQPTYQAPPISQKARVDLLTPVCQWFVQGNPIVRVGLVILFVGLSFLARYAAQAGLFPVELRLAAIGAVGLTLLIVGFRQRSAKPALGLVLQGGGVAVLYLTAFAAFRLYQLMPQLVAFAFMVLVCALSCALALLQNARTLAFAAFAGGFATPLLLATGGGSYVALFSYDTLLNLAILFIATRRAWRELNLLGFIATFGMAGAWGWMRYSTADYAGAQTFLIVFIAIFIAMSILYARAVPLRLGARVSQAVDSTLVFGTPLLGFGLQAGLMQPFEYGAAFSALAFGAVYLTLAALLLRCRASYRLLTECFLALGVGFVTLTVPLALDVHWSSAVWALEGAAAFWVGMRQARWMVRAFGLLLQALACLCFFGGSAGMLPMGRWPLAHTGFVGGVVIALPALATAWWTRQPLPHSESRWAHGWAALEARLPTPLLLYGLVMWLLAWWLESIRMLPPLLMEPGQPLEPAWPQVWAHWLLTGVTLLSCAALLQWALRARWTAAAWPSRLTLLVLLLTLLAQWGMGLRVADTLAHVTAWPAWLAWPLALALHVWLLRRNECAGANLLSPAWRGWMSWQHTGTVWLLVLLIGDALAGWADWARLWGTDWVSVIGVVAATAVLLALTRWAGRASRPEVRTRLAWPLNPHAAAYYWRAAAPLALLLWLGAFALAWTAPGHTAPLPYLPIINPTDLAVLLVIGALLLWRAVPLTAEPRSAGAAWLNRSAFWGAIGVLALVALSTAWLRVAHHYFYVDWNARVLYRSFVVQTGYAILWTLLALTLMVVAHRRGLRSAWLAGAALLALVVAKLMLNDLSNRGGGERIVAFIGVGVLMLIVGYFAPLPPKSDAHTEETP